MCLHIDEIHLQVTDFEPAKSSAGKSKLYGRYRAPFITQRRENGGLTVICYLEKA